MKLDIYLREHRLTSARFAEISGIGGKQAVHQYRHGLRFPTPENLRRIREATNGAVTADDFVDQYAGASPPPAAAPAPKRGTRVTPPADSTLAPAAPKRRARSKATTPAHAPTHAADTNRDEAA